MAGASGGGWGWGGAQLIGQRVAQKRKLRRERAGQALVVQNPARRAAVSGAGRASAGARRAEAGGVAGDAVRARRSGEARVCHIA